MRTWFLGVVAGLVATVAVAAPSFSTTGAPSERTVTVLQPGAASLRGPRATASPPAPVDPPEPARSVVAAPDAPASGTSLTQTIRLEIVGGSLSATPTVVDVPIRRVGRVALGEIPAITVVDARGTLTGWRVEVAATADTAPEHAIVVPAPVRVVHGNAGAVRAGRPDRVSGTEPAVLAEAAAGDGGGTFVAAGRVVAARGAGRTLQMTVSAVGG